MKTFKLSPLSQMCGDTSVSFYCLPLCRKLHLYPYFFYLSDGYTSRNQNIPQIERNIFSGDKICPHMSSGSYLSYWFIIICFRLKSCCRIVLHPAGPVRKQKGTFKFQQRNVLNLPKACWISEECRYWSGCLCSDLKRASLSKCVISCQNKNQWNLGGVKERKQHSLFLSWRKPAHARGAGTTCGGLPRSRILHDIRDGLCHQLDEHPGTCWQGVRLHTHSFPTHGDKGTPAVTWVSFSNYSRYE